MIQFNATITGMTQVPTKSAPAFNSRFPGSCPAGDSFLRFGESQDYSGKFNPAKFHRETEQGEVAYDAGLFQTAVTHFEQSLNCAGSDSRQNTLALQNIGLACIGMKDFEKAENRLLESLTLSELAVEEFPDRLTTSLTYLGRLYQEMGRLDEAMDFYNRAQKHLQETADTGFNKLPPRIRRFYGFCHQEMGKTLMEKNRFQAAVPHLETALRVLKVAAKHRTSSVNEELWLNYALSHAYTNIALKHGKTFSKQNLCEVSIQEALRYSDQCLDIAYNKLPPCLVNESLKTVLASFASVLEIQHRPGKARTLRAEFELPEAPEGESWLPPQEWTPDT